MPAERLAGRVSRGFWGRSLLTLTLSFTTAASATEAVRVAPLAFEHVLDIGSAGTGEGQFAYVQDFAFARDGQLLVTDASHAWIQLFDGRTGRYLARFGGRGGEERNLDKPEGIAVDPAGNIFVADFNMGCIKTYDVQFNWQRTFGDLGSDKEQIAKPTFIDVRDGRLYVPDIGTDRIYAFDLAGKPLFSFGGLGTAPGKLADPAAAKFAGDGRLFVTDQTNNRIQIFDATGKFLAVWGRVGTEPGEFKSPAGLAFDADDNVYVTEIGNNRVQVFDKAGKLLAMWGRKGSGPGEFANPRGIMVDKTTGRVFVADTGNNRIQVFRPVPQTVGVVRAR